MSFLHCLVMAIAVAGLVLMPAEIVVAGRRLGRRPRDFLSADCPVTIVRPLCGVERFSEATPHSGFRLDHPAYELVFCVASSADPVIPIVSRLMAQHPAISARLLVGDDRVSGGGIPDPNRGLARECHARRGRPTRAVATAATSA